MNEPFDISVDYKNKSLDFAAQLFTSAFSYQIQVVINEVPINFERDDSGDFRAIAALPDDARFQKTDPALLHAIAHKLEEILS